MRPINLGLIEFLGINKMLNGIKGSDLLIRNGLVGMGCGGVLDLLYFDHVLVSGFGLLLGLIATYIYLIKKHGRKNLNQ